MKWLLEFIVIAIIFFVIGLNIRAIDTRRSLDELEVHKEYYNKTEELLDSICANDSAFIGITETQTYSDYLIIRDKIRVE